MKTPYDLDRIKLLHEAKDLVALAIKRGWMSYPRSARLSALGTPIVVIEEEEKDDEEIEAKAHSDSDCRKAYDLRERGLTLDQVAIACAVQRGFVSHLIAQGHELYLKQQRIEHNATQASNVLPKA